MTSAQQTHLLYQLYQYRALGYEYIEDVSQSFVSNKADFDPSNSLTNMCQTVNSCHLCPLVKTRKNSVFGEGNPNATLMFIGEGPGANEDETGRPFVGRAGELLTRIITNVLELKRQDVYIANIVKCRPPKNRVPTLEEVSACKPYIMQQIELVNPKIIVALGSTSYHHLTSEYEIKISQVRGEVFDFMGRKMIPTFHPSFLLRNPSSKKEVYQDMLRVKSLL